MAQDPFGQQIQIPKIEAPKLPPGVLRVVLILGLLALVAFTSFYQIEPDELGVVTRFGRHVTNTVPGLHFKLPFGIDRVYPVPVQRQLTAEFGFRTQQAGVRSQFTSSGFADESNMLTGDLNAAVVEWVVQYRIVDPYLFLFRVRNVEETFRDMSEAVMREVVGDRTVNEVITVGREEVAQVVHAQLQELCEQYQTGIQLDQVVLQDVTPPKPVKPAFNEVNQAEQQKARLISEAQSEYNKVVPRARGEAEQVVLAAEGYGLDRVNRARGQATRFTALYEEYRKAPEVTRQRMYLETLEEVLPALGRKIVVDDAVDGVLPLLQLDTARAPQPRREAEGGEGGGR